MSTDKLRGESCLFARRRSGTPKICGLERTLSTQRSWVNYWGVNGMIRYIHTKYFPTFAETFSILGIDDIDDGVAISIISVPDIADASLTA